MKTRATHRARQSLVVCALAALASLTGCAFETEPYDDDAAAVDALALGDGALGYPADAVDVLDAPDVEGAENLGAESRPAAWPENASEEPEDAEPSDDDEGFAAPLGEMFRGVGEPLSDAQPAESSVLEHPSVPVLR